MVRVVHRQHDHPEEEVGTILRLNGLLLIHKRQHQPTLHPSSTSQPIHFSPPLLRCLHPHSFPFPNAPSRAGHGRRPPVAALATILLRTAVSRRRRERGGHDDLNPFRHDGRPGIRRIADFGGVIAKAWPLADDSFAAILEVILAQRLREKIVRGSVAVDARALGQAFQLGVQRFAVFVGIDGLAGRTSKGWIVDVMVGWGYDEV